MGTSLRGRRLPTLQKISSALALAALMALPAATGWAKDIRIKIPRHSELTPVQKLNQEGVEAVRKKDYDKGETLFLKAYLYDPTDPFTLNNLGYVAELKGDLDRALKFYQLASEQGSTADIARSNQKQLVGKPISEALNGLNNNEMRVNHLNVQAVSLLAQNRGAEAQDLLEQAAKLSPENPFTLNNLGVTAEAAGDYEKALGYFDRAAQTGSKDPVVVTLDKQWRGKSVSEMAAQSAHKLEALLKTTDNPQMQAALLAVRGVSATNRNDWTAARADFLKAYALDPYSAFSLNNLGYVAEKDGDMETAQFFYQRAQAADDAKAKIGLATDASAEGERMLGVSADSQQKVGQEIAAYQQQRQAEPATIQLYRRDGAPVTYPAPQQNPPAAQPPAGTTQPNGPNQ